MVALDFMRSLWRVNHALERMSMRMEDSLGVTAQQRMMLRWVGKLPGISAGQLAERLHVDAGTVSAAAARLERKGLLSRRRDVRDRRRVVLALTRRGQSLDRPTSGTVESAVERLLRRAAPRDIGSASRVLADLTHSLEEEAAATRSRTHAKKRKILMKRISLFAVLATVGLAACAHKAETKPESKPVADSTPTSSNTAAAGDSNSCTRDLDCGPKQLCIRNRCVDISANLAECGSVRIYFPLNTSDLPADASTSLERSARCLKADLALHVTIEGNADERGTEEYNLALGDRRATAVAKGLERLGASQAQLKTVSYGKENPLCVEHDEDCWSKNRRAELQLGNGGKKPAKK